MIENIKKPNLLPFGIIGFAIICAIIVGFYAEFSWLLLIALLLVLLSSIVLGNQFDKSSLTICRLLVGALFVFSSLTKGVDPLGTKYKILDYLSVYGMEWMNDAAIVLAVVMILAEFVVGICLIFNVLPRLATLGATLLMLFFTITTFFDALLDLVPDCGCFGTAIKMSNWQTFFKNLIINAVLIPLIFNNRLLKNKRLSLSGQWILAIAFMLVFTGFEIYNIRHLPVVDFMDWKIGNDMSPKEAQPADIYLTFKNKETGKTQEYLSPDYPWNDSVWASQWEFVSQRSVGGSQSLGFAILDDYGEDVTHLLYDTEKLFVFVAPYLKDITEQDLQNCSEIINFARENEFNYLWITSVDQQYVNQLREDFDIFDEVYYGDELELKTMVRSNPGLMLIDNGVIIDKWSKIDFPTESKILKMGL